MRKKPMRWLAAGMALCLTLVILSWYSRLQLELRLNQVEERLITSSAE